jgi:hypothetical protein
MKMYSKDAEKQKFKTKNQGNSRKQGVGGIKTGTVLITIGPKTLRVFPIIKGGVTQGFH